MIQYEAVIKDLERRRGEINAEFDAAIAAMRRIASIQASGTQKGVSPSLPFVHEAQRQPFRELSMVEAAIAHIKSVGHPVRNPELAKAVEAGGFHHKSKNFPNTLNSILWRRAKKIGDLKKSSHGWELVGRNAS